MNKDTQKNYDNRFIGKLRGKRIECEQKKPYLNFILADVLVLFHWEINSEHFLQQENIVNLLKKLFDLVSCKKCTQNATKNWLGKRNYAKSSLQELPLHFSEFS